MTPDPDIRILTQDQTDSVTGAQEPDYSKVDPRTGEPILPDPRLEQ